MRWTLKPKQDNTKVLELSKALQVDASIASLLIQRDIDTYDKARTFFRPSLASLHDPYLMKDMDKALRYMGLSPKQSLLGKKIDYVFIGSCTNSRIEDLRLVADFVKGKKKADNINVWIVPGSKKVEAQAIEEGLDRIFKDAGFDLRQPGCSACLAMNEDKVPAGKYCVSTSNRNFEGRQGPGSRTFLVSPLMAAAAAVSGEISDVREMM